MTAAPLSYFVPVEGLTITRTWMVGRVTLHPGADVAAIIRSRPVPDDDSSGTLQHAMDEVLAASEGKVFAELPVDPGSHDVDDAIDEIRDALDVLRVFLAGRQQWAHTPTFGLAGDLYHSSIRYILVGTSAGLGGRYRGSYTGLTLSDEDYNAWAASRPFQYLSRALATDVHNEGTARAVLGARLFGRAIREYEPDLKVIGLTSALEAWILVRKPNAQTLLLARNVAWFSCGHGDPAACGRGRDICPYLYLDPTDQSERKLLNGLEELGAHHNNGWRCSEWFRVSGWYAKRSDSAHGGEPRAVAKKVVDEAEHWIARFVAGQILEWLEDHQTDPVGDLDRTIKAVPMPADRAGMVDAIRRRDRHPPGMRP